jgi:hypothetical protein
MMIFIGKVNNYMFRPKAAILGYDNYNFAQRVRSQHHYAIQTY